MTLTLAQKRVLADLRSDAAQLDALFGHVLYWEHRSAGDLEKARQLLTEMLDKADKLLDVEEGETE